MFQKGDPPAVGSVFRSYSERNDGVALYIFCSILGFSVLFIGLLFLNWHFDPSQFSAMTANSDQLSYLTSWG